MLVDASEALSKMELQLYWLEVALLPIWSKLWVLEGSRNWVKSCMTDLCDALPSTDFLSSEEQSNETDFFQSSLPQLMSQMSLTGWLANSALRRTLYTLDTLKSPPRTATAAAGKKARE